MQQDSEESSDTQSEHWEVGDADDDDVEYVWDQREAYRRQMQLEAMLPVPALPEPTSADQATAMLARVMFSRITPEGLKRLLDARADPNTMVGIANSCPLDKVLNFAREAHVPAILRQGPMLSHVQ